MDAPPLTQRFPRALPAFLVATAIVLVPWTLALAIRLPANHTAHHWDTAWVGFDVALAAALAVTGICIARRSPWATAAATAAATLLACDAWFDNLLASTVEEHVEAALEAGLVEIPLALLCLWLARNVEQAIAAVLTATRSARAPEARARAARADADDARAEQPEAPARRTRHG